MRRHYCLLDLAKKHHGESDTGWYEWPSPGRKCPKGGVIELKMKIVKNP
jgi:hypothetical protein